MRDDDFEKVIDAWADHEIESAPEMRPTAEMHRLVRARQKQSSAAGFSPRWAAVGVAVAGLVVLAVLYAVFFQPSGPGQQVALVAQRQGFAAEKGVVIKKGSPSEKGPRRGPTPFRNLLLQFQKQGSQVVEAIDLQNPPEEMLTLTSADNYRLLLELAKERHVYVFQLTSSGLLVQLFPNEAYSVVENPLQSGQIYYLPSEPNWLYLDETVGEERLYIVATAQRSQDLEDLYARYSRKQDEAEKQSLLDTLQAIVEAPSDDVAGWLFNFEHR